MGRRRLTDRRRKYSKDPVMESVVGKFLKISSENGTKMPYKLVKFELNFGHVKVDFDSSKGGRES